MPEAIEHNPVADTLEIGAGRISGVTATMWRYETSGYRVISRWFDRRKLDPGGKRSSPLDDLTADRWDPTWTRELVDLLHVVRLLTDLETDQADLLAAVLDGPHITTADLTAAGVLPVQSRPTVEQPGRPGSLFG